MLCTDGPVRSLIEPALVPERRRSHGSLYGGLDQGRIGIGRLRRTLAGVPRPKAADGRLVLAADVSPWLRPDAATVPDRHPPRRGQNPRHRPGIHSIRPPQGRYQTLANQVETS
ncbi:transposase [Streptomyces sp. NBC_00654]|nr:transposase [Streptomyces sp. NBC_00654]